MAKRRPKNGSIDALKERVKELNCLYGLTEIIKDKSLSFDGALLFLEHTLISGENKQAVYN